MESQSRTLAKTVSWRIFATLITSTIVWQITGKAELGLSIATLDCLVKLITYYLHERTWNLIGFGYKPGLINGLTLDRVQDSHGNRARTGALLVPATSESTVAGTRSER